ncbi:MAG TPA: hypothetical protein VNF27_14015 [Candidatus Binataceae bacterium]|nr:hypothetical protein [Candidatus Binataceae bacterium]
MKKRLGLKMMIVSMATLALSLSACVRIMSSSVANSNKVVAGNSVTAQASDMGFLELVAPVGLTQTANSNLSGQCPGGKFTDATTELSLRDFFAIVQMYQVDVTAICQ